MVDGVQVDERDLTTWRFVAELLVPDREPALVRGRHYEIDRIGAPGGLEGWQRRGRRIVELTTCPAAAASTRIAAGRHGARDRSDRGNHPLSPGMAGSAQLDAFRRSRRAMFIRNGLIWCFHLASLVPMPWSVPLHGPMVPHPLLFSLGLLVDGHRAALHASADPETQQAQK